MCGICGSFGAGVSPAVLQSMNQTLYRRGPDDEGYYHDENAALAMRRLSIIDVKTGHQPIANDDETVVVVFNGEIYNYKSLRNELIDDGFKFRTHSDTEVILNLYLRDGLEFAGKLRGMFAVAIWDKNKNKGILARDSFGIKPLYYSHSSDGLLFASELKALVKSDLLECEIDPTSLDAFFAYGYIPGPRTIYSRANKLQPGSILVFSDGQTQHKRYYDIREVIERGQERSAPSEAKVDSCISDSVMVHLESDVPVSAFLSGGIDSSIVVTNMAEFLKREDSSAYTISFQNSGELADESEIADELCRHLGVKHNKITVNPDSVDILRDAARAFDEPFGDDSVIPNYVISEAVSKEYKVALTGLGGDEFFGGYSRYEGIALHASFQKVVPSFVRKLAGRLLRRLAQLGGAGRVGTRLQRFAVVVAMAPENAYVEMVSSMPSEKRASLYRASFSKLVEYDKTAGLMLDRFRELDTTDDVKRAMYTDICTYLPEDVLALSDRIAMWHSLELRVPFVDVKVAEVSAQLSTPEKVRMFRSKPLLRSIIAKTLPKIGKGRKQGFESPIVVWMKEDLRPWISGLLSAEFIESTGILSYESISTIMSDHFDGRHDNSKILFRLLMFALWWQECHVPVVQRSAASIRSDELAAQS